MEYPERFAGEYHVPGREGNMEKVAIQIAATLATIDEYSCVCCGVMELYTSD